jgi:hypothetical protein
MIGKRPLHTFHCLLRSEPHHFTMRADAFNNAALGRNIRIAISLIAREPAAAYTAIPSRLLTNNA